MEVGGAVIMVVRMECSSKVRRGPSMTPAKPLQAPLPRDCSSAARDHRSPSAKAGEPSRTPYLRRSDPERRLGTKVRTVMSVHEGPEEEAEDPVNEVAVVKAVRRTESAEKALKVW